MTKRDELIAAFTTLLGKCWELEQSLIDEKASTREERQANDRQIYAEVGKLQEQHLRALEPARLDIYFRNNGPRERVIDSPNGLWLIALPLQDFDLKRALTEDSMSVILAVEMADGVAKFSDFVCGVICLNGGSSTEDERIIILDGKQGLRNGKKLVACTIIDDPECDCFLVDDESREEIGVIVTIFEPVVGEVCNAVEGELNSAEALFAYALFKAVGGSVIDEGGHEASQSVIGDCQWLRCSVVAE